MEIWLIFSLLSVLVLAGTEISQKISLTQKVNISAITNNFFVWTFQGIIGLSIALIVGQFSIDISQGSIIKLILISFVYFAGGTLFYSSYKGNSPSISIILGTISVIISSTLGTMFLNETWSIAKIIGIIFIISAIFILNINNKEKFNKYNFLAIAGGICYGVAYTLDKSIVSNMSPFMYLGLMCLGVAIVSLLISFKTVTSESKALAIKNFYPMFSSAIFGSAFNIFTFFAYKNGANVGIADAINNSNIFFVIILEILILKDKSNLLKKLICAIIAFTGIIIIGLF